MTAVTTLRFFARVCLTLGASVVAFTGLPVMAQDLPALFRVTGVAPDDRLNLRAAPSARSAVLGGLAADAADIEVVARSPDGRWGRTNLGEVSGWVAMRFLQAQSHPDWHAGLIGLACLGTEPFWSLRAFLPSHRAEFVTPDNGGVELVLDAGALPATQFPRTLALPFSGAHEGMAVLRPAACSDGMSDMAFGIEAQLYFRGQVEGLSGCCRLMP